MREAGSDSEHLRCVPLSLSHMDHRRILVMLNESVSHVWFCQLILKENESVSKQDDWRASVLFTWHPNLFLVDIQKAEFPFSKTKLRLCSKIKEVIECRYVAYAWCLRRGCLNCSLSLVELRGWNRAVRTWPWVCVSTCTLAELALHT